MAFVRDGKPPVQGLRSDIEIGRKVNAAAVSVWS